MNTENITIGREYPLEGILTLPENTDVPVPACVLVHGSGSSDKDEKIFELRPFADIANELALHGIASLRYDKRSFVHGRQMVKSKTPITVYEETIEDAVFAADLLRNNPRIDHDRIFIIGHSMGAMLSGRIVKFSCGSCRNSRTLQTSLSEQSFQSRRKSWQSSLRQWIR